MARKALMEANRMVREKLGKPIETASRMKRNRKRNKMKEVKNGANI